MYRHYQRVRCPGLLRNQRGFQIIAALVVIALVLFTSRTFMSSLFSIQQELSSEQDKTEALRAAEKALLEGEGLIEITDASLVPRSSSVLLDSHDREQRLVIWGKSLNDYKLEIEVDVNTGAKLHWWDQPSSWWSQNATLSLSTDDGVKSYFALEHLGRGRAGEDLTDGVDYLDYPGSHYFRVTGKSIGARDASVIIQSTYAKKFF